MFNVSVLAAVLELKFVIDGGGMICFLKEIFLLLNFDG